MTANFNTTLSANFNTSVASHHSHFGHSDEELYALTRSQVKWNDGGSGYTLTIGMKMSDTGTLELVIPEGLPKHIAGKMRSLQESTERKTKISARLQAKLAKRK